MKKFYLPLMMGLLSASLFSQNTFVTGNAKVKVQPSTLFYHGGDFTILEAANDDDVVENAGNIKINGSFVNEVDLGKNFLNILTNDASYGQVIINDGNATALVGTKNRLTMEKRALNSDAFTWGQFAIPYSFTSAGDAHQTLFGSAIEGGHRYEHSIMTWDNITRPEFDHIGSGVLINPTNYVILNLVEGSTLDGLMGDGTDILKYSGTPANAGHSPAFRPDMYSTAAWSVWQNQRNIYGEKYSTYIEDLFRDMIIDDATYGQNHFQFGNPYTSNIDLSYIGSNGVPAADTDGVYIENLAGVTKLEAVEWVRDNGEGLVRGVTAYKRATYNSGANTWGGDAEALIIKPFESFVVVLTADATGDRTFPFNEGLKTFSYTPKSTPSGGVGTIGRGFNDEVFNEGDVSEDRSALSISMNNNSFRTSFYQLGLTLYTEDDKKTGNVVYVIVDRNSQNGVAQPLEAIYTDFNKGFFLTQEKSDGSEVSTPNQVMQINTVHPKYVSKPIPLFFQTSEDDYNGYYVKADLFYKNIFNKLKVEDGNFFDGNSFFFYDKAQDVLLPITTDFSYYIERAEETQSSRYVVYWNGGPAANKGKMEVSDELSGITQVYKDGDLHKIRFNENWSSADVSVYDLAGRAIFKEDGVSTDVDYVLDLPKSIVYVVKIQSNTGETVTQKILK